MTLSKVLIANRGEIACRIARSCRGLGVASVAVYSEADAGAAHVELADEAFPIGPPPVRDSYLKADRLIETALAAGADAVHPGYGFLAESPDFARKVIEAGLVWIGPDPDTIADMGDKERARALADGAGAPILPGSRRFAVGALDGLEAAAEAVGYPLLVKAACGGGGIGMRRVDAPGDLEGVVTATQSMAEKAFGDGAVYLERFVPRARHVEAQVFGFGDGGAVHLFDRDCSLQRRFQKIVEEAPAPALPEATRAAMLEAAVGLAKAVRYSGAGTVEFIYDVDCGDFYFLEMNTRIQVEHPATEMALGVDLVGWQIRHAGGALTPPRQEALAVGGSAVEVRIYAERPEKNFLPSPGVIETLVWPETTPHLRIDTGVRGGDAITPYYDPMIAKLIARGADRAEAIARMEAALAALRIDGVRTNIAFLRELLASEAFRDASVTTDYVTQLTAKGR